MIKMSSKECQKSRRDFLKKAAYTAPVILTMSAAPAFAKNGSPRACKSDGNHIVRDRSKLFDGPARNRDSITKRGSDGNGRFARYARSSARERRHQERR